MDLISYLKEIDVYKNHKLTPETHPDFFNALLKTSNLDVHKRQRCTDEGSISSFKFRQICNEGAFYVIKDSLDDKYIIEYEISKHGYAHYRKERTSRVVYFVYPTSVSSNSGMEFKTEKFNYLGVPLKQRTDAQLMRAINKLIKDKGLDKQHIEIHHSDIGDDYKFVLVGMTYEEYNFKNLPKKIHPTDYYAYDICKHCGKLVYRYDCSTVQYGDDWYCSKNCMRADGHEVCVRCSVIEPIGTMHKHPEYTNTYLCDNCFTNFTFKCAICGDTHTYSYLYETMTLQDGELFKLCTRCARNPQILKEHNMFKCESCGHIRFGTPSVINHRGIERKLCGHCAAELHKVVEGKDGTTYITKDKPRYVYGYHDYERIEWYSQRQDNADYPTGLYLGCELEIDTDDSNDLDERATVIVEAIENDNRNAEIYLASDGSLSSRGVELITQPASPAFHLNLDGSGYDWEKGMEIANDVGYESYDAGCCGLHFHVNRSFFSGADYEVERKLALFIANNYEWLKKFSRRTNYSYCSFSTTYCDDIIKCYNDNIGVNNHKINTVLDNYIEMCDSDSHSYAVNFSHRCDDGDEDNTVYTIEFRFIRGTLKYSTFAAAVQLISMICELVEASSDYEEVYDITKDSLISLAKIRNYTFFLDYMKEKNLMD